MTSARPPRNPWPFLLVGWFILFISAMVGFILYASSQNYDLVRKDYYEEELRYQQHLDRLNRAQALSHQLAIAYDPARQAITLCLPPQHAQAQASGRIQFYRPADASLDHEISLTLDPQGRQEIDAHSLPAGLWKIRVTWTVAHQEFFFDQAIVLQPASS